MADLSSYYYRTNTPTHMSTDLDIEPPRTRIAVAVIEMKSFDNLQSDANEYFSVTGAGGGKSNAPAVPRANPVKGAFEQTMLSAFLPTDFNR